MGEKDSRGHRNGGIISSVKLFRGFQCDKMGVDIFATCDERYGTGVRGIGRSSAGKVFASSFLWKSKNTPSGCSRSKYVASKEIQSGPIEPCGISIREIHQFDMCNLQSDWCSHGQEGAFNR